jgi:Flp pilus assembly protein TadG
MLRAARAWRRFRRDHKGLAAVEFALILPVMITLFFGIVELSMALAARADVTNMASIAADLVAQESSMTAQDMSNVFAASSAILYPYSTTPATITV